LNLTENKWRTWGDSNSDAQCRIPRKVGSGYTPGIAGGKARIAGHQITVQNIAIWHERLGLSADEIATECGLSLADVYAALAYYYDHLDEIDRAIREDEEFIAELRRRTLAKLSASLGEPSSRRTPISCGCTRWTNRIVASSMRHNRHRQG